MVFKDQKIVEVKRQRVLPNECLTSAIGKLVLRTTQEYGAKHVVVENGDVAFNAIEKMKSFAVRKITVVETKRILLPDERAPTLGSLYGLLLKNFEQMTRFVALTQTGELSKLNDRRRLLPLLALGLGLADRAVYLRENVDAMRHI